MPGAHQVANASVALAIVDRLVEAEFSIDEKACRAALATAHCPGRIEPIGFRPTQVFDTAHNRASAAALVELLGDRFPRTERPSATFVRDQWR